MRAWHGKISHSRGLARSIGTALFRDIGFCEEAEVLRSKGASFRMLKVLLLMFEVGTERELLREKEGVLVPNRKFFPLFILVFCLSRDVILDRGLGEERGRGEESRRGRDSDEGKEKEAEGRTVILWDMNIALASRFLPLPRLLFLYPLFPIWLYLHCAIRKAEGRCVAACVCFLPSIPSSIHSFPNIRPADHPASYSSLT